MPFRRAISCASLALTLTFTGALIARAQAPTAPTKATPTTVFVAQYRAQRVSAQRALAALAARTGGGARDATSILKSLDKAQLVRRADGQTQRADGARWDALIAGAPNSSDENFDISALNRAEIKRLQRDLQLEIAEVDAWNTRIKGAYYAPVDAGTIVKSLEQSGQIRTGPTWLQAQTEAVKQWFLDKFWNLLSWLGSLFVRNAPTGATPDLGWLNFVFWLVIAGLVAFLLLAAYRAFAGNIRWGGRRKRGDDAQMQGDDAELLLLPPDELVQRAARFAAQDNFREALRHRYIALLLRLDSCGVWRYDTRRTNWEHIAALRAGRAAERAEQRIEVGARNAQIVAPLSDLTRRFDRVRYGDAPCDDGDWRAFERDAQTLETSAGANSAATSMHATTERMETTR